MINRDGFAGIAILLAVVILALIGGATYVHYVYLPQVATQSDTSAVASSTATISPSSTQDITIKVTGSQSLSINQQGTWSVIASDPGAGWLSYSVVWGEAGAYAQDNIRISGDVSHAATFVHTYTKAGVYPLVFTVINDKGQTAHASVWKVSVTSSSPASAPAPASTITLDAATKVAVVQAIMNGIDILSSSDAAKIRSYIELQDPKDEAYYGAMSDSQILQLAAIDVGNGGKPTADLATDSTAVWKVNGNVVTVNHKTYAAPNPAYPALASLTVTYQAVYVNGVWH